MALFRQFQVPGIRLTDIKKFTGYSDVKKACEVCGIKLWQLNDKEYNPLSVKEVYKIIKWIRAQQYRQPELPFK
jgi:hypothetical protein